MLRNYVNATLQRFLPTTKGFPPEDPGHDGAVTAIAIYFVLIFTAMGAINAATGTFLG